MMVFVEIWRLYVHKLDTVAIELELTYTNEAGGE